MKPKLTKDLLDFSRKNLISDKKNIFWVSAISSLFLFFVYLNSTVFKLNDAIIGFFQELFTIPSILVQPLLLFISLRIFVKMKFKIATYAFCALVIALITTVLTWGSLIIYFFKLN